jgi:hypothetical protein
MTDLLAKLLPALLPSVVAAVITGFVTIRLMPRQFYRQRWWERKAQAYIDIVAAISDLDFCFREWLAHFEGTTKVSDQYQSEISKKRTTS